ncbi:vWA domain-containing protein [Hyphomicrobium sp.]|uniref:vWA domain-containing protein n=1 Tax=Hyphomicrobium sp. TaxID=82 RepID=UPI002D0372F0|nr:vWA domain-containing protein [Hyphomicrobium sp.]HRN89594.1 VWA domain-containing protein [Hyphomicrobium sp.]HRQ25604.1 VWA domain-containing protein [Hyphomicrobium sp.]
MRERLEDVRFWVLLAALALTALALLVPRIQLTRNVYDVVAIVDLTKSMLTRDMHVNGKEADRLEATKRSLTRLLADMPCQSRLGLGIFTERRSFLLFNPVEVCENFAPVEIAIQSLDWRMAWEGDSMVTSGIYSAVHMAEDLGADLIFLTDGHEAPPLPGGALPEYDGEVGKVRGFLAGVGGRDKVPLPKIDDEGNETGQYGHDDVPQENRSGAPPPDAHLRPGWHPKWAPFGTDPPKGDEHLAYVRSEFLEKLAAKTGLAHVDLIDEPNLLPAVRTHARPRPVEVWVDIRPIPAALALALLVALYAAPFAARVASQAWAGGPNRLQTK